MLTKSITPEIGTFLSTRLPLDIPYDLQRIVKGLGIKAIYYLKDNDLSKYGVFGNHVVIVDGNQYLDFEISPIDSVNSIITLLS